MEIEIQLKNTWKTARNLRRVVTLSAGRSIDMLGLNIQLSNNKIYLCHIIIMIIMIILFLFCAFCYSEPKLLKDAK